MRWVREPSGISSTALVIGTFQNNDVIAFLIRQGDKPLELRYATGSREKSKLLLAEQVAKCCLHSPFNYLKGTSKIEKWRVSCFIKYYFLKAKLVADKGIGGDTVDMANRFQFALNMIWEKKVEEKKRVGKEKHLVIEESEEEDGRSSPVGVKTRSTCEAQKPLLASPPMLSRPIQEATDYDKLKRLLQAHNELYLLENIPAVDEMTFKDQKSLAKALPKKLFVGTMRASEDQIYAYMRFTNNFHEIRFYSEDGTRLVTTDVFAQNQIFHPFNKTFPRDVSAIDQGDRARATLLIKWYFIAAGIAERCVLKETKDYPNRFRQALAYIAERMGGAAAKPPVKSQDELDESYIQLTLDSQPSPTSSPPSSKPSTRRQSNLQQSTPQGPASNIELPNRKRTAEDAQLEGMERTLVEDRKLTKEMNSMDDRIDLLRMQLHAAEAERERMNEARKEVRKRLKRESLAFSRGAENE
jgi:hypothetical protein